jgi:uncharacterized ubiquitin-like protein YukD
MESAFWTIVGFVAGLLGNVVIIRRDRFYTVLDQLVREINDAPDRLIEATCDLDLTLLSTVELFRREQFELYIQGQLMAGNEVRNIRLLVEEIVNNAKVDVEKPQAEFIRKSAKNDIFVATKILINERITSQRSELILRAMNIRPDWLVWLFGGLRGSKLRVQIDRVRAYLHGTGELRKSVPR